MPKFLEEKLKKEYPGEPDAPYKVMNSLGLMKGNKETKKGRAEEKKHEVAMKMREPQKKYEHKKHSSGMTYIGKK